jgi:CheY-like chemotaxis protein
MESIDKFQLISRKLKVLLAEDDNDDILLFKEALNELPVSVHITTVTNGQQLLEWLNKKGKKLPDVLFLDLNMPRKNGFAALGEIKRNQKLQNLPVVIFSTARDEEMIKQVYNDAAHYYIRKPSDFTDLKKVIYRVLKLIADRNISLPNRDKFILTGES